MSMNITNSAIKKGETLIDTAMTLNAMHPDIIVIRHQDSGACNLLSQKVNCAVLNAGDGRREHPTQALLDALTIIDRKKKIFSTTLLLALGYTKSEIVDEFYESEQYTFDTKTEKWKTKFNPENYKAKNFSEEVIDAKTGEVVIKLGDKINFLSAKKLANDGLKDILVSRESLFGKFLHRDVTVSYTHLTLPTICSV